jgi:hypothetical protein
MLKKSYDGYENTEPLRRNLKKEVKR